MVGAVGQFDLSDSIISGVEGISWEDFALGERLDVVDIAAKVRRLRAWRRELVVKDGQHSSLACKGNIHHAVSVEISELHDRHLSSASLASTHVIFVNKLSVLSG